jgi:poly-gamma-glutamate capsule biosynthesis protein CapA/YwtB (metallophosphatase superfamily)
VSATTRLLILAALVQLAAARSAAEPITVALGGDVLLGRGVARRASAVGWPRLLDGAAPVLRAAGVAIVNLESPLARCLPGGSVQRPRLCGDARGVAALAAAGIDAVTLANNHALDAGRAGLRRTARLLRRAKIVPLGLSAALAGRPVPERVGPVTVVAASLTPAAHPPGSRVPLATAEAVGDAVRRARRRDPRRPVLVLLHAGRELYQGGGTRHAAHLNAAVEAGAAAVVLHGAHVVRRLVVDRGVPVHLGLGNLLFDQRDVRARLGQLVTLRLALGQPAAVHTTCVDSRAARVVSCAPERAGPAPKKE